MTSSAEEQRADPAAPSAHSATPGRAEGTVSRGMTIVLAGNVVPPLAALLSGPVLAQALGVGGRGEVAAAMAPLGLAIALTTFGIPEAVTYAVAQHPRLVRAAARNGFGLIVLAGLLATGALLAARPLLSGGDLGIQGLMVVSAFAVLPTVLLGVLRGIASGMQRWRQVAREKVLASVLRLLVLIPLWLTDHLTPFTATVVLAVMPAMGALAYITLPRKLPPREQDEQGLVSGRSIVRYGSRLWIGTIATVLIARADQTLMTPLSNAEQLGLYVVAVNLSELPLVIHRAVRDVTFVTDANRSEDTRLTAAARISTLVSAIAAVALGTSMLWWLPLLFGEEFSASLPVAAILLLAVVISTPGSIAGAGLSARGKPGWRSVVLVIVCVLNIALLVLLLPRWGAMGAAWATLISLSTMTLLKQLLMRRHFGVPVREFWGLRRSDLAILRRYARRLRAALVRRVLPRRVSR
ncbi:oligosaccharide flippase family protein [Cellulomonas sp. KRMCY2]|uniref:oligosaccharide flippase family protein n=1 Tax=Cellulomonas sp. KRMCY2 TaxID=1304865 RepID=UPI00045E701B|nr:oligosaccharide flippase family protein [Cellulomonas sp. KRMCY2]